MVDQHVIDGDNAAVRVLRARVLLKPLEPLLVQFLLVPLHLREKPVEAGLISGHGELAVHATHGFSGGNHQAREVLGKMPPLGLVNKNVAELLDGRRNDGRKRSDPWHACTIRDCHGHLKHAQFIAKPPIFSRPNCCLQKSSYSTKRQFAEHHFVRILSGEVRSHSISRAIFLRRNGFVKQACWC